MSRIRKTIRQTLGCNTKFQPPRLSYPTKPVNESRLVDVKVSDLLKDLWLPISAFEELMLSQDSYLFPCVIMFRLELQGTIERGLLEKALQISSRKHLMLQARLERRWRGCGWIFPNLRHQRDGSCGKDGACPEVQDSQSQRLPFYWHWGRAAGCPQVRSMDLFREDGIRVDVFFDPASEDTARGQATLFFQVHHALADGMGCLEFLYDMLDVYNNLLKRSSVPVIAGDPCLLKHRYDFGLTFRKLLSLVPQQWIGLAGVRQFLARRPVVLGERVHSSEVSSCPASRPSHPAMEVGQDARGITVSSLTLRLNPNQTLRLRAQARRAGVTTNDLLATAVFRACDSLCQRENWAGEKEWLRMMVPVNLRRAERDQSLSACNMVSCVFLDRQRSQIREPDKLLTSVHREMQLIKDNDLSLIFIFSLWLRKKLLFFSLPSPPKSSSSHTKQSPTTFVFSNLGRLPTFRHEVSNEEEAGRQEPITMLEVEAIAPLAPSVRIAFVALEYDGALCFSIRYDPNSVTQSQSEWLRVQLKSYLLEDTRLG